MPERQPLKRSTINRSIEKAMEVFRDNQIHLPPFAFWSPEQWESMGPEADAIRDCMLGWDVTDFGSGEFERIGRTLFTLRNGRHNDPRYPKTCAEKAILDPELQRAPAHFHRSKREDIINRGGGNIMVQLRRADDRDRPSDEPLVAYVDGMPVELEAGGTVRLEPGMSVCIEPRTIHQFWGEEGTGFTVSGEVSSVCDDLHDNAFIDEYAARFPQLDEDEPRRYYLCNEYPPAR